MLLPGDRVYHPKKALYGRITTVNIDSASAVVCFQCPEGPVNSDCLLADLERCDPEIPGPIIDKMVYVAHPLGPMGEQREANRYQAGLWCAAFAKRYRVSVCADWIVLSGVWAETHELRTLGIQLDLIQVGRCDEIWLTGPKCSEGMSIEGAAAACVHAKPVRSFIGMDPSNLPVCLPETLDFRPVVRDYLRTLGAGPQPLGLDYSGH